MAGAEAIVPCFSVEKPEIPKRLTTGSKFLKWPKADDVRKKKIILVFFCCIDAVVSCLPGLINSQNLLVFTVI